MAMPSSIGGMNAGVGKDFDNLGGSNLKLKP